VPQEIGIAKGCNKVILPVVMEEGVPIPGFISNLKYLAAHKNWDGSFEWLAQFVRDNAGKLAQAKFLGGLAATLIGGIMLSNPDADDEDDEDDDFDEDDEDDDFDEDDYD
jgi:hypothetical protein